MNKKSVNRGLQLRMIREYRGYSQQELCSKISGLSQSNLSKYENGFEGMIDDKKIEEIMSFLKWPVGFLEAKHQNAEIFI